MAYDISRLRLAEITQLGAALRDCGNETETLEQAASAVIHRLYEGFADPATGRPICALARFYLTVDYSSLDGELREFGARLMPAQTLRPETPCLTLLATRGDKPEWNDRRTSEGHRTIPLPSDQVVGSIPMIASLLAQLGLDVATVLRPDPKLVLELEQHAYNVFFVPDAVGSPHIPAQAGFVVPAGVRSVLGFGGLLPSGQVFAVLLFTRVLIPRETADMFRNLAMNVKVTLLPLLDSPVFDDSWKRTTTSND